MIAASVAEFLAQPTNRRSSDRLRAAGVDDGSPEPPAVGRPGGNGRAQSLAGKAVVVTGTVPGYTREEAEEAIVARGGTSPGSVSKKTFVLVVGDAPGRQQAQEGRKPGHPHLSTCPRSASCSSRASSRLRPSIPPGQGCPPATGPHSVAWDRPDAPDY